MTEPGLTAPRSTARSKSRSKRMRYALIAVSIIFVGLTFFYFLPQIADYRQVWGVIKTVSWPWLTALLAATVLNVLTYAPPWIVALPGLGFRRALVMSQASSAITYVAPGGGAVGVVGSYGLLRSWGYSSSRVARAVTLTGVWNQFANLAFPILALFLLTLNGQRHPALTTAAFVGVALLGSGIGLLVLVLYSEKLARDVGDALADAANWALRRVRRAPVTWGGQAFARFRNDAVNLLRRRWLWLTLATLAGNLTVFLLLLVSLRAFDVPSSEVSVVEAFAAWALARILGSIPLTPGGVGVIELSLTATLVAFGGNNAGVVAAVLVYRFLSVVPTLALGGLAVLTWRHHRPHPA